MPGAPVVSWTDSAPIYSPQADGGAGNTVPCSAIGSQPVKGFPPRPGF